MSDCTNFFDNNGNVIGSYTIDENDEDLLIVYHPDGESKSTPIGGSDIELLARDLLREIERDKNRSANEQ